MSTQFARTPYQKALRRAQLLDRDLQAAHGALRLAIPLLTNTQHVRDVDGGEFSECDCSIHTALRAARAALDPQGGYP